MHGRQQLWFNGRLFHDWRYIQGKSDGHCVSWYSNGQKHFEGNFIVGKGKLKGWYESGKPFLESDFRDGKPIGQELCWHENGSHRKETHYDKNGIQHGSYRFWDERGRLRVEKQFNHGTLLGHKEWDENGTLTYSYSKHDEDKKTTILNKSVPYSYGPSLKKMSNGEDVFVYFQTKNKNMGLFACSSSDFAGGILGNITVFSVDSGDSGRTKAYGLWLGAIGVVDALLRGCDPIAAAKNGSTQLQLVEEDRKDGDQVIVSKR